VGGEPPPAGATATMTVAGARLLVANVGGTLLAYRNACGACSSPLDAAAMTPGGTLTCPSCERSFELRRAGRAPDDDDLQVSPVPLLRGEGRVRVAVG
jgi:nitrite reductase/ring-hydroxylating ferredoxin subunit